MTETTPPATKFTIEKDTLLRYAATAAKGTPANPRMPILGAVLLDLAAEALTLSATDYETFLELRCTDVAGDGVPGQVAIPAKAFSELLRGLPPGKVTVEVVGEQRVRVKGGRNHFRLVMMPVLDFPATPEVSGTECTVDGKALARAVSQVLPAVSHDEGRPVLNGMLWAASGNTLVLAATDSYRMAVKELEVDCHGQEFSSIIPGRTLERLPETESPCTVTLGEMQARLAVGDTTIVTRLIEGNYPPYQTLIPAGFPNRLTVKTAALIESLEAVVTLLRANTPAVLHLSDEVRVTGNETSIGDAEQYVDGTYEGEPMTVGVNGRFLVDALRVLEGEEAVLDLIDPGRPMLISAPGFDDYRHLLMPVRLGG